jgi:hypothetical protein
MPEDTDMSEFLLSEAEQNTERTRYLREILDQLTAVEETARTAGFVETAEALKTWLDQEREKFEA